MTASPSLARQPLTRAYDAFAVCNDDTGQSYCIGALIALVFSIGEAIAPWEEWIAVLERRLESTTPFESARAATRVWSVYLGIVIEGIGCGRLAERAVRQLRDEIFSGALTPS